MRIFLESGVTHTMIKHMAYPLVSEQDEFELAKKVAKVLNVPNSEVLTWYRDTEAKLLAIYMEIVLGTASHPRTLAKKYNIYPNYMRKRLQDIKDRMEYDVKLQAKILKLNRFFLVNDGNTKRF